MVSISFTGNASAFLSLARSRGAGVLRRYRCKAFMSSEPGNSRNGCGDTAAPDTTFARENSSLINPLKLVLVLSIIIVIVIVPLISGGG
jgi:hypothetical protein